MLIDINLNTLKFLIEPSYEKIKDKIPYIIELYIEEFGEQYRKRITDSFDKVNYLFIIELSDLERFINSFERNLVESIYKKLFSDFKYEYKEEINFEQQTNFIERLFKENGKHYITSDNNLDVYRNDILSFVKELHSTTEKEDEKKFLKSQIEYIMYVIKKFDSIQAVLKPKKDLIEEILDKQSEENEQLKRAYIRKHQWMLNREEINFINQNPMYNVSKFIQKSERLNMYINPYFIWPGKITNILEDNNMRLDNIVPTERLLTDLKNAGFFYIDETGKKYEGIEAINSLNHELKMYDQNRVHIIENIRKKYKFIKPKEQIVEESIFSEKVANRSPNLAIRNDLIDLYNNEKYGIKYGLEFLERITNTEIKVNGQVIRTIINAYDKNTNEIQKKLFMHQVIYPLRAFGYDNNRLHITVPHAFCHECGHVASSDVNIPERSGFGNDKKYKLVDEIFNDILCKKINSRLNEMGIFLFDTTGIVEERYTLYNEYEFILKPIIDKYYNEFKIATIENNPEIILNAVGKEKFENILTILQEFVTNYSEDIFEKNPDYIKLIEDKVSSVMNDKHID